MMVRRAKTRGWVRMDYHFRLNASATLNVGALLLAKQRSREPLA